VIAALNETERRVLGSLMEKSMAQPEYYPMTEKALVAACNQKQNRDPVMELDEDTVWHTLETLREKGLVTVVLPGPGARSKRYKHEVESVTGWQKRERVVMTELLLRGPQTPGELRSRCSRFMPFDDLEAVTIVLDCLAQADPPVVKALPREPGRSAIRYTHLLYPADEKPAASAPSSVPAQSDIQVTPTSATASPPRSPTTDSALREEIESLQEEVADLHQEVAELRARLENLENHLA
jgi:uncharacterized protein YceH (UPF0502 family)